MNFGTNFWVKALLITSMVYFTFVIVFKIDSFPGLHGDEAWFGIKALSIIENGVDTPHGMNNYTGVLYPYLVSIFFQISKPNVLTLRLLGSILNSIVLVSIVVFAYRKIGKKESLFACGLILSSLFLLMKARIAWEVYALQPFFVTVLFYSLYDLFHRNKFKFIPSLIFLLFNAIGIFNHFIFLIVPVSLVFTLVFSSSFFQFRYSKTLNALLLSNFLMAVAFYYLKYQFPTTFWINHKSLSIAIFLSVPLIFNGINFLLSKFEFEFVNPILFNKFFRFVLLGVFVLGLGSFFVYHEINYLGIYSGVLIFKRLFSVETSSICTILLYAGSVLIHFIFFKKIYFLIIKKQYEPESFANFVFIWTIACMAFLIVFVTRSSFRYFSILNLLLFISLIFIVQSETPFFRKSLSSSLILMIVVNHYLMFDNINKENPPMNFQVGLLTENSFGYIKFDSINLLMQQKHITQFKTTNYFIDQPLLFYLKSNPIKDSSKDTLYIEWCETCKKTPFFNYCIK